MNVGGGGVWWRGQERRTDGALGSDILLLRSDGVGGGGNRQVNCPGGGGAGDKTVQLLLDLLHQVRNKVGVEHWPPDQRKAALL